MGVVRIDHFDDPRLKDYREISDAELLRRRNLFVGEGRLIVARLIDGGVEVESVLVNGASWRALEPCLETLPPSTPVYVCDAEQFRTITGFNLHRGCLAIARRPRALEVEEVARGGGLVLVLEAVTDADNVGSAFRNAAAFGASGVLLSPTCCDPLYRKAVRTSMGAVLRVPFARARSWPSDVAQIKTRGFTVVALTPDASAIDLASYPRPRAGAPVALLVGTEGAGLSTGALELADVAVRIPMHAGVDSLNLATAAGIALYHLANPS